MEERTTDIPSENGRPLFTAGELKVLQLVSDGHTSKSIANILYVSVRTVETRRAAMMDKSGTKNTATLIKFAVKHNLVT